MQLESKSYRDTLKIGKAIAKFLKKGDIVCLFGKLGAGKTLLTKGIAKGLGISADTVNSPSFVIMNQYDAEQFPIYHFDFYRLKSSQDIAALGYEEYFYSQGVSVIEWADRLGYLMPDGFLKIELLMMKPNSKRLLKFSASGSRYKKLLKELDENIRN